MSKRFLSLLMALMLCFSTLPSAALAETAAEKTQNGENTADVYTVGEDTVVHIGESGEAAVHTNHPICGDEDCTENDHKLPDNAEWVGVSTLDNYMAAGYYYLTNDVNLSDPWSPINNVTLCLNGKIITASSFADVIDMRAGKTITLCDCDTQGRGAVISDHRDGVGVYLNESTLNLYSGTITGTKYGVHLAQDNSTFNMHGGSIKNSSTGVYMKARPNITNVFNMTGGTISGNGTGSEDVGGVYVDESGAMTVSGNASVSGNTDGNVYLTEGKSIAIDGNLGETAAIGVRIPAIADGSSATVATGAKETDLNRFSDDSGNNYTKKFADGNIIFASGEPHEHQICGDNNCTESGHGSALFSALKLSKTAAGDYELPEGNWYLTKNLNLDATLCITGNTQLCLNGYSITATAAVDAIELANGSALTLCDCNGSGKNNGIITHGADADGTQYNGRGIFSNGSFTMYSGKICGNSLSGVGDQYNTTSMKGAGGGVCVTSGVFTMYGGEISGNTLSGDYNKGAGVCGRVC